MRARWDVRQYAIAWLLDWPDKSPEFVRGDLELTPQLIRLARQYRREIECQSAHVGAQRLALSMSYNGLRFRRNMMLVSVGSVRAVREGLRVQRKVLGRKWSKSVRAGFRRAILENPSGEDLLAAARRADAEMTAMLPEEIPDAMTRPGAAGQPVDKLSPGTVRVLLSEPETRSRDGNDELIKGLTKEKGLAGPGTRHAVDEMYSTAYENSEWLKEPIRWMWEQHLQMLKSDFPYFWLPPFVLVGPPGCGKTHLLQAVARLSGVPYIRIDMSGLTASFALTGLESGWGGSRPGEPVSALSRNEVANPLILLDELEKAGRVGNAASPYDGLLPLLQRETARDFRCPAIRANVDLSHVTWAAAANSIDDLPAPLLDRMTVLQCDLPKGGQLRALVDKRLGDLAVDRAVVKRVIREMEAGRLSMRGLARIESEFRRLDGTDPLH